MGGRPKVPRETAGEDGHAIFPFSVAAEFDEPRGCESSAFGGDCLRMEAAADVDVVVFVPCEAAGRVVFEQRFLRPLRQSHIDVDQRQRQPGDELNPLGERTFQPLLRRDQAPPTDDGLASVLGGRLAFN